MRTTEPRDEILQAAAELFMQLGYAATSIDAVAESLGATKGHIYHYFDSKAELYFEVRSAAMTRLTREIEPIARGPGDALDRLARMALRHMQILLTELPMQKVAVQGLERRLFDASPAARQLRAVIRMRDDYEKIFAGVIEQATADGVLIDAPARLLTKPFFGAMNWATVWYTPRGPQEAAQIEPLARMLAASALRGILKSPLPAAARQVALLRDRC